MRWVAPRHPTLATPGKGKAKDALFTSVPFSAFHPPCLSLQYHPSSRHNDFLFLFQIESVYNRPSFLRLSLPCF